MTHTDAFTPSGNGAKGVQVGVCDVARNRSEQFLSALATSDRSESAALRLAGLARLLLQHHLVLAEGEGVDGGE